MDDRKRTHLDPHERQFVEETLKFSDLYINRSKEVNELANREIHAIEVQRQEQALFEKTRSFREQNNFYAPSTPIRNVSIEQPVGNLQMYLEELDSHIRTADYYAETADLAIQGKLTPPKPLDDLRRQVNGARNEIEFLREQHQTQDHLANYYSQLHLRGGEQE